VGPGIAKIDEHPIAHVFSNETIEPGDRFRDAFVISANYRTQIFGIEPCRECGRANEVGEHHSQLTALGVVWPGRLGLHRRQGCRYGNRNVAEIADRAQHFASIAEQDPQLLQILIGEIGKDAEVNAIFDETLRVLGHAESFEPVGNLLHRGHRGLVGT